MMPVTVNRHRNFGNCVKSSTEGFESMKLNEINCLRTNFQPDRPEELLKPCYTLNFLILFRNGFSIHSIIRLKRIIKLVSTVVDN